MSPLSIMEDVEHSDKPSPSRCCKVICPATCSNVAALTGLQSVTPCSIAYVAIQVHNIVFIVVYATDLCGTGGTVAFHCIQHQQLAPGQWRIWSYRILQWDCQLFQGDTKSKGSGLCWQLTPMVEFVSQLNSMTSHIWWLCRQVVYMEARAARGLMLMLWFQKWPPNIRHERRFLILRIDIWWGL